MAKTAVLILDNIRSVENTGSIFRTAEGLGVSKIYLVGTTPAPVDRFGRKRSDFAKVSLGAEETMDWTYVKGIKEVIEELKSQNFQVISLEQNEKSKNLKEFKSENLFALVVGNEVEGVSKDVLDLSDEIVEIEMKGKKESLNVSVAAGIALFELLKIT
ncbi:TrmH family RNA methyltransferase [Candidatus Parcubacteria bacterium]|nr:TrmH family RNA methyltransferase [Candidatus Parcubacteria bacterium]